MIRDVEHLLSELLQKLGGAADSERDVRHPVVMGKMYEGAVAKLLTQASASTFSDFDIRICSGFVQDASGCLSKWADCMVCVGPGREVPNTTDRVYPMGDVLLIAEVKKTLYGEELKKALLWFRDFWTRLLRPEQPTMLPLVIKGWTRLLKKPWPRDGEEVDALSVMEDTIMRRLMTETKMPARVVFGFHGYKDEEALRKGFTETFEGMGFIPPRPVMVADINALPNLVVCGEACLVKMDGFSYPGYYEERSGAWCWYGSKTGNPLLPLLEILWTRLQDRFDLPPDIFGPDLENEGVSRFMSLRLMREDGGMRWNYFYEPLHEKEPGQAAFTPWEPCEVDRAEFSVLYALSAGGVVDMDSKAFKEMLSRNGVSEDELVAGLRKKEFVGVRGRTLELLTEHLQCMALPDGRMVAAENDSGRLTEYVRQLNKSLAAERGSGD